MTGLTAANLERWLRKVRTMRLLMFIGVTVGGSVGWWLGSYGGIWTALIVSTVGSIVGVYVVYRLTKDYL